MRCITRPRAISHRRGHGDVETLTVREYLAMPRGRRRRYRFVRNPFVLFGLGPIHFVLHESLPPRKAARPSASATASGRRTSALSASFVLASLWIGWRAVLLIYGPAMYIAAATGIWLFYVQHQFENTYWQDHGEWDYATAAIRGSSYLKLPAVLHWFTGSIGLHHVHHLGPRIPNYALKRCHEENAVFHDVTVITLAQSCPHAQARAVGRGQVQARWIPRRRDGSIAVGSGVGLASGDSRPGGASCLHGARTAAMLPTATHARCAERQVPMFRGLPNFAEQALFASPPLASDVATSENHDRSQ